MSKITFSKLKLKLNETTKSLEIDKDISIMVKQYLPQEDKAHFIEYVISKAIDENTGCSSPIRTETFFSLAIVQFYTNITFTETQLKNAAKTYDLLQNNGIFENIIAMIPEDEFNYIYSTTNETIADITRYNTSFAGLVSNAYRDTDSLTKQLSSLMESIKNKEGLEELSAIKEIVG